MNSRVVDGDIQLAELEEAMSSPFEVVAPSVNLCAVVSWVGLPSMEIILEEVTGVALHARYTWLDEGLCNVVDDLVGQP